MWCKKLEVTRYLRVVEIYTIHGQLLGIFQEVHLCFARCHPPDRTNENMKNKSGHEYKMIRKATKVNSNDLLRRESVFILLLLSVSQVKHCAGQQDSS